MTQITLNVFNPQGETVQHVRHEIAPRATDLNGKTIGLLFNWLSGGDDNFTNLRQTLSARFENLKFVEWRSEATTPLDEKGINEVLGPAKQCDAVIGFTAL
ncbi:MAG: hypothetical protein HY673_25695 [Chloroflexi bacterium]|nr:hypothetical protein [Chloroflexota bacterium]